MNERIKQLAEQAGYKHSDAVGMCEDYAYFDHEKFAELIIKECAKIADDNFNKGFCPVGDYIKQHFGVE
jgi:hypothetical protein